MKEPIITEEIFDTLVILALQNPKVNYILVEGSTDYALFSKFFYEDKILFFDKDQIINSKKTILSTIKKVNNQYKGIHPRILAIIDRDFDTVQIRPRRNPVNVIYVDNHDLDSQIFFSEAFMKFFTIYCFEPWNLNINHIRETVETIGIQYGIFKLAFHNMYLSVRNLSPPFPEIEELINLETKKLDNTKFSNYLTHIFDSSQNINFQRVLQNTQYHNKKNHRLVSSGHDLIRIVCIFILEYKFGIRLLNLINSERDNFRRDLFHFTRMVENNFRSCYDLTCFKKSDLYKKIVECEKTNKVQIINK